MSENMNENMIDNTNGADIQSEEEYEEFVIFKTTTKDGDTVEMAVLEEFEYDRKNYVVAALVEEDAIAGDDRFIYRLHLTSDGGFEVSKITDSKEYDEVVKAYLEMEE